MKLERSRIRRSLADFALHDHGGKMGMNKGFRSVTGASVLLLAGCASTGNDRGADAPRGVETRSMDGSFTGEVVGQAAPDSGFAKLRIGMSPQEVQEIMDRVPDR